MVNHGASTGCLTCRKRRVKCDEARPNCAKCTTRGVACEGYGKKPVNIRFKTQSINIDQSTSPASSKEDSDVALTIQPSQDNESLAVTFFINGFAIGGRSLSTSRGFFESIVPVLTAAGSSSTVSVATTAVSALLLHRWKRDSAVLDLSQVRLGQALQQLQADLKEPTKRSDEATLLSILMLQCYENTRATLTWDKPTTVHRDGALLLIKNLGLQAFQSDSAKRLLLYLLNADINAALREARSVDPDLRKWAESTAEVPFSLSSQLDLSAIRLAEIQEAFFDRRLGHEVTNEALLNMLAEVLDTLQDWADSVPKPWHPFRFRAAQQPEPPVEMYLDTCEVYATIEAASIWNTWRIYNLIALDMRRQIHARVDGRTPDQGAAGDNVQVLMDSICFSIPFYLGNRSKPSAMETSASSSITFPNFHNLHLFGVDSSPQSKPDDLMTAEDMQSNATTQGAWQLASVLRLLVFTLSKPASQVMRDSLRPGQLQWLEQQVIRVSRLFGVRQANPANSLNWSR